MTADSLPLEVRRRVLVVDTVIRGMRVKEEVWEDGQCVSFPQFSVSKEQC